MIADVAVSRRRRRRARWPVCTSRVADRLGLDWIRDRVAALPRADRWQTEARAALRDDIADLHRALTESVLPRRPGDDLRTVGTRSTTLVRARTRTRWRATSGVVGDRGGRRVRPRGHSAPARRELRELCELCGATATRLTALTRAIAANAARAAFAPHAPCTPPPGCADADARNRPRTGVSARPSPGTGRNTSCCENAMVPPPSAPPTRLALRASSAGGGSTWRAVIERAEPGRQCLDLGFHPVGERLGVAAVPLAGELAAGRRPRRRVVRGTWVYAHTVSVPGGRAGGVGLVHLARPARTGARGSGRRRGRRAYGVAAVHAVAHVHGAGARRRARPATGSVPTNAQSILNVPWSYWNRSSARTNDGGQVLLAHELAVQRGRADVGEHRARRVDRCRRRRAAPRPRADRG